MHRHLKCHCKAFDIIDGDIAHLSFDVRDKGTVQTCLQSKVLLSPTFFSAKPNDVHRKEFTRSRRARSR